MEILINNIPGATVSIGILAILTTLLIFLTIKLWKKNYFIKTLFNELHKIDKNITKDNILNFLVKLQITGLPRYITRDQIFNQDIQNFIFKEEQTCKIFLHYTKERETAENIIHSGFKFVDSFYKTAENIFQNETDFIYKHNSLKPFGNFIIVICISNKIFDYYTKEINKTRNKDMIVEQVLTESPPVLNEDADTEYILVNKYIKGFINYENVEIVENPEFDPYYDSNQFSKNLNETNKKNRPH
jgi:hypothetical protein